MWKSRFKYIVAALLLVSFLLSGCTGQGKPRDVVSLITLNFELEDFIGKKIWTSGFYGDGSFTGDGVGFLVTDFDMLIVNEKLPDHRFARLDGELPPYDMSGEAIIPNYA